MHPHRIQVAHFCAHVQGGAAIAARRLHHSLLERGASSRYLHRWHDPVDASYQRFAPWSDAEGTIGRAISRVELAVVGRISSTTPFTLARAPRRTPWRDRRPSEIAHLHWISHLLDLPSFLADLPREAPLVWTVHDMNPFTGGCHYSLGCDRYRSGCAPCPVLARGRRIHLAARNAGLKRRLLRGRNLHVVADSRWIEACARDSEVLGEARTLRTIHYGLDTDTFAPSDAARARAALGLPADGPVVAFGAHSVAEPRKGMPQLLRALARLASSSPVTLLSYGTGAPDLSSLEYPSVDMGFVAQESRLALCYAAADVFVVPSLEEAFGQTALEATACGTPVVAFDTGGLPDTVVHDETGRLVPVGSVEGLTDAIQWMLDHPRQREAMGQRGRERALERFGLDRQAEAYLDLYDEITR